MHDATWQLHDAVIELARERGLRSYRVECKVGPEGETMIVLVLPVPNEGRVQRPAPSGRRWR
jgi:hypothetical protein